MKKIILILVTLSSSFIYSQDVYDIIAKETCECVTGKKLDLASIPKDDLQKELGLCMIKSYTNHNNEFKPEEKINLDDSEGLEKMGEKIALKMLVHCPDLILELGKSVVNDENNSEVEPDEIIEGELIDIKTEQFVTIVLKDKNARLHNFLILDYFDTASLFTNNEIKKKDSISVSYSEYELYDPKLKEFRYFKVISKLEKK